MEYLAKEENENKEKEVIDILNLNFIQFFNSFIKEDLKALLNRIRESYEQDKESNKDGNKKQNNDNNVEGNDLEVYLAKVEEHCINFEAYIISKNNPQIEKNKKEKSENKYIYI